MPPVTRRVHAAYPVLAALAVGLAALALLAAPRPAGAQAAPEVRDTQIAIDFPRELTFSALVENADALAEAVLFYKILPESALTRRPAEIQRGDVTRLTAALPTGRDQIYVPAGADIEWYWQLTTTDGSPLETARQIYRYEDPRYEWRSVSEGLLTFHYYEDEERARGFLRAGLETLASMGALLDVRLAFPVRAYLWSNQSDASGVARSRSETFDELVLTGGTRALADLLHIFQPTAWVLRHELTHILAKQAGEGGIGSLPSWIDEGTATYAEGDWRSRRGNALAFAAQADALFNVRSMGSVTNQPGRIDVFYGQAADLVTLLIDDFGAEEFAHLFAVFNEGSTVDNALQTVYGFDRDGLDALYRQSLGVAPRGSGEDLSTSIEDEPIPAPSVGEEGAGEAIGTPGEQAGSAEDVAAAGRTGAEIDARQAEIEGRLAARRSAPTFGAGDGFPWAGVVTGLGGGALLISLVLVWLLLLERRPAAPAAATAVGPAAPPPGPGGGWAGWRGRDGEEPPNRPTDG